MKINNKPVVVTGIISAVFMVVAVVAPVSAIDSTAHMGRPPLADMEDSNSLPTNAKLSEAKLRLCQKREKNITSNMQKIAARGEKHIGTIDKISAKVQDFYKSKNLSLSNYDALVADASAKKTTAQNLVNALKTNSTTFKCDSNNPKLTGQVFQDEAKDERTAIKDYRTSVKNLIVGVKSVAESTSSDSAGGTQE